MRRPSICSAVRVGLRVVVRVGNECVCTSLPLPQAVLTCPRPPPRLLLPHAAACRPHDGTVLFVLFRGVGLFRERPARSPLLSSLLPFHPSACRLHCAVARRRRRRRRACRVASQPTPGGAPSVAAPSAAAGPNCERDRCMIRSTPSLRSGRHYGAFLLIQVGLRLGLGRGGVG